MMKGWSIRGLMPALVLATTVLCISAGAALADGVWLPDNFSTLGESIDRLWGGIFILVVVFFILTEGLLLLFIFQYRRRKDRKAAYIPHNGKLEFIWSVIPGAILLFLAIYQWNAWADAKLRPPDEADAVRVQIYAQQFEWNMRYAGPDNVFATADDITLKNQLYVPEGKMIYIQLRAMDVIHSFFLPNMRVKQDIVPGQTTELWFDVTKTGDYEIACTELCGLGHYRMRGLMFVKTMDEFEAWIQERVDEGRTPADWGWDWDEGV